MRVDIIGVVHRSLSFGMNIFVDGLLINNFILQKWRINLVCLPFHPVIVVRIIIHKNIMIFIVVNIFMTVQLATSIAQI